LVLRKSTSLNPELGWEVDKPREEAKEATSDWRRLMSSTFFECLPEFDFAIVYLSKLLLCTFGLVLVKVIVKRVCKNKNIYKAKLFIIDGYKLLTCDKQQEYNYKVNILTY
jgi:hypothetical protein